MFKAGTLTASHYTAKTVAMKRLTLLLMLTMAPGPGVESIAFSGEAGVAGVAREGSGARPTYEYGTEHQIKARDEKDHSNQRTFLPAGPKKDVDENKLKVLLLLMLSAGPYRSPGREN